MKTKTHSCLKVEVLCYKESLDCAKVTITGQCCRVRQSSRVKMAQNVGPQESTCPVELKKQSSDVEANSPQPQSISEWGISG